MSPTNAASLATMAPILAGLGRHPAYPTRAELRAEAAISDIAGHDLAIMLQARAILARARAELAALPAFASWRLDMGEYLGGIDDVIPPADDAACERLCRDCAHDDVADAEAV